MLIKVWATLVTLAVLFSWYILGYGVIVWIAKGVS